MGPKGNVSSFKCMRCSHCCYFSEEREYPVLLPHEAYYLEALAHYLGVRNPVFERLDSGFYRWVIKGVCPFYDETNRSCKVHNEKPLACRMFPLLINTSTLELLVSSACRWVSENAEVLVNLGENVEKVFPAEFEAVRELLSLLYVASTEGLTFVLIHGESNVVERLGNECRVVSAVKSSIAKGLQLVLVSGCSGKRIEELLRSLGLNTLPSVEERLENSVQASVQRQDTR